MSTAAVDIHSKQITLEALREELVINRKRLEEKKTGKTPLMVFAEFGNVALCEFLLSIGAKVNASNAV